MQRKIDHEQYCKTEQTFEQLLKFVRDDQLQTTTLSAKQRNILNQFPQHTNKIKRLLAILASNVMQLENIEIIDANAKDLLKIAAVEAGALVLANRSQLVTLHRIFSENDIQFILLKGSAFNNYIYHTSTPRISNDIDILIMSSDWQKAEKLMNISMNYAEKSVQGTFADLYEVSYKPKEKVGFHLDMHKLLIHPYLFNIDEKHLWQTSIMHPEYNSKYIRILPPELNILHLALHAYKDMDFYTYNLIDCHRLISQQSIDWHKMIKIAESWGAKNVLYFLLCNCYRVLGTVIPEDILIKCIPNIVVRKTASYLLCSKHRQPDQNKKTLLYRVNQILSQFIFTGSFIRPLKLQFAYLGIFNRL
jgi:hypothetical protein